MFRVTHANTDRQTTLKKPRPKKMREELIFNSSLTFFFAVNDTWEFTPATLPDWCLAARKIVATSIH